ncbi:MAG TPA: hypothetical protein VGE72_29895 [Azospirillum sp.]
MRTPRLAMLALSALVALPAAAQDAGWYRQGLPDVLAPAANTAPDAVVGAFRAAYRRHGSPRVAVFWMRRLSDRVAPEWRRVERVEETVGVVASGSGRTTVIGGYGAAVADSHASGSVAGHRTRTREVTGGAVPDAADDWLPEEHSQAAEAALLQEFGRAGVKLVDRAAMLRLQGAGAAGTDRPNPQAIEAAALRAKADLLVEITATPSADSATGVQYRIDVKDTRSALILASFVTDAEPRAGARMQFTTKPGRGYVAKTTGAPLGQELALQVMEQLAAGWRR